MGSKREKNSGGCGKKSKHKKDRIEKHKKKKSKKSKKESRREKKKLKKLLKEQKKQEQVNVKKQSKSHEDIADVPVELMEKSKAMAPMTKEEWEKRQSVVRRVYDEESGRHRLVKGDGEIIEEIVSRDRHKAINKTATVGDGLYFQSQIKKTVL